LGFVKSNKEMNQNLLDAYNRLPEKQISRAEWDSMPEYSLSVPSGVFAGKMWRCNFQWSGNWLLCWYTIENDHFYLNRARPAIED
jgi:hypothetical protein